jgi:hypothetical protein
MTKKRRLLRLARRIGRAVAAAAARRWDVLCVQGLSFHGYWAPTDTTGLASSKTYGTVTFDMLRTSGAKYALIELAAWW